MQRRKIIHIDMDAFFAAVEQRDNPQWKGKPVIVGGMPDSRGVVATCSYEARKFGIHSAMSSSRAYKLCPQGVFVKPRISDYQQVSRQIHSVFLQYTDLVEPLSLDEAYLDVSQLALFKGSATLIAEDIRKKIFQKTALTASAGISYNKFLAKVASDMNKPNGQFVITPEQGEAFVAQLPVGKFYGVGKVTEKKMHEHKIFTGADLKNKSLQQLGRLFGKSAQYYFDIARGEDHRPVVTQRARKSIGSETTLQSDIKDENEIKHILQLLTEEVCVSLRKKQLCAKTINLKVKYHDFEQITRQTGLDNYSCDERLFFNVLCLLLKKTQIGKKPVRLLGVSVSDLGADVLSSSFVQLSLFDDKGD